MRILITLLPPLKGILDNGSTRIVVIELNGCSSELCFLFYSGLLSCSVLTSLYPLSLLEGMSRGKVENSLQIYEYVWLGHCHDKVWQFILNRRPILRFKLLLFQWLKITFNFSVLSDNMNNRGTYDGIWHYNSNKVCFFSNVNYFIVHEIDLFIVFRY